MDELEETHIDFKPSFVLIAIDTHSSMFKTEGAPSPFKNCLKSVYRLCDALLLKSDKRGWSPFAISLFDEDEKCNLVNFKDNMIETNKLLKQKSSLSEAELRESYMRKVDLDLSAFFQICKKKFKDVGSTFYKRILIFITDDPDPVNADASKRFTALNEAKNFKENDIDFQLVVTKETFDFSIFYTELFSLLSKPHDGIICEDEEGLYEKLTSTIWFKHSQRKLVLYPFPDDFSKYITVYKKSYLQHQRLLNNDFVAVDGTPVKRVTKNLSDQNVPTNVKYDLKNKDSNRTFEELTFDTKNLLSTTKEFPIGYTLLYVCHRLTELGEVIAEPKILEADSGEELKFFQQFWQHCVDNDKVLICAKVMKANDKPRAVELIPKLIHNNKVFLIKQIPYADEIFEPINEPSSEFLVTDEQMEITDMLIEQLKFDFSSSFLIDAEFTNKVDYIKSKLLDESRKDNTDREFLNPEEIDQKTNSVIGEYLANFPPIQGTKRKKN